MLLFTCSKNGESKVLDVTSPTATHFSVWLNDDWSGTANSNIYLKPTTELVLTTLSLEDLNNYTNTLVSNIFTNEVYFKSPLNENVGWALYDLTGKFVQKGLTKKASNTIHISAAPPKGIYLLEVRSKYSAKRDVFKLIKN